LRNRMGLQAFIHEGLLLCYAGQISDYQRHKDFYKRAILFEDVITDPEKEIREIFNIMEIGHEHVPGALESLKEDSQRGTFGPRGKRPKISDEEYAYLDSRLRDVGMDPRITCQMEIDTMREILDFDDKPQYDLGPIKKISWTVSEEEKGLVELLSGRQVQEEEVIVHNVQEKKEEEGVVQQKESKIESIVLREEGLSAPGR